MLGHVAQSLGNALPGGRSLLRGGVSEVFRRTSAGTETFTIPTSGLYLVQGIGGGATGARNTATPYSGGSGAGYGFSVLFLEAGTQVQVLVGDGGAVPAASSPGNAGGATQVVIAGLPVMEAQGGKPGQLATGAVAGGAASGFQVNLTGSGGGTAGGGLSGSPRFTPSAFTLYTGSRLYQTDTSPGVSTNANQSSFGANPGEVSIYRIG